MASDHGLTLRAPWEHDDSHPLLQRREPEWHFAASDLELDVATLLDERSQRFRSAASVTDGAGTTGYWGLLREAETIRGGLLANGVTPHCRVAVSGRDFRNHLTTTLAVLGLGCVVVPLDASWPRERLKQIVGLARPEFLIGQSVTEVVPPGCRHLEDRAIQGHRSVTPRTVDASRDAFIFFTSGSEGKPKGVRLSHRAVVYEAVQRIEDVGIRKEDRLSALYSQGFSAWLVPVFSALLGGASLHPLDLNREMHRLPEHLESSEITISSMMVSVLRVLCDLATLRPCRHSLRFCGTGGEGVRASDVRRFHDVFGGEVLLMNGLGSTEVRTLCGYVLSGGDILNEESVPVGYPVPGKSVTVVDDSGQPVPIGTVGTIEVASRYIATGYLLAAGEEDFPRDDQGRIVFRTGDLGRLDESGCLHLLGRADGQVKIRGHRVEPREVEAALLKATGVNQACCLTVTDDRTGAPTLVAAVTGNGLDDRSLRRHVAQLLPAAFVPVAVAVLRGLPLTPTGKTDRRQLSAILKDKLRSRS